MALLDFHVLAQSLVYFTIAVFGLLIVITTSVTKVSESYLIYCDAMLFVLFEWHNKGR